MQHSSARPELEALTATMLRCLTQNLAHQDYKKAMLCSSADLMGKGSQFISLNQWCAEVVINSSQKAYFGDCLSEIEPHLSQAFVDFDTRGWQLIYHYPRCFSKEMHAAKDKVVHALAAYFDLPPARKKDAALTIQLYETGTRELGLTSQEMGALMMSLFWG